MCNSSLLNSSSDFISFSRPDGTRIKFNSSRLYQESTCSFHIHNFICALIPKKTNRIGYTHFHCLVKRLNSLSGPFNNSHTNIVKNQIEIWKNAMPVTVCVFYPKITSLTHFMPIWLFINWIKRRINFKKTHSKQETSVFLAG